jgi:hypothetical protein
MESITNAAEEILIDSLSFKIPGSGQYVQERRSVTFQTEGSNSYSPNAGTRVIRFKLSTEGWLDPSTVRIFMDVVNTDPGTNFKVLRPIGAVHAFFRRLRLTMRGVVIEDIMDYSRVSEMFDILSAPQVRLNAQAEGFGHNTDNKNITDPNDLLGIRNQMTVCFKPLSGILMQSKYIPIRYCPLEIELELADMEDPIITNGYGLSPTMKADIEGDTALTWKLESCQLKCDICTLDNALDNNYVAHLLGGKKLNIVYNTFISNIQTVLSEDTQINVSRSLSRLRSVFLSLERDFKDDRLRWYNKQWNSFYSPMAGDSHSTITKHIEGNEIVSLQLQIGAFLIPQYPIRSHAECFYSLKKALGIQGNSLHSIDIEGNEYRNNKFIVAMDCEKLLGLAFTGMNTKNSLMTVRMKTEQSNRANRFHILLTSEQILEVSDAGISVYD